MLFPYTYTIGLQWQNLMFCKTTYFRNLKKKWNYIYITYGTFENYFLAIFAWLRIQKRIYTIIARVFKNKSWCWHSFCGTPCIWFLIFSIYSYKTFLKNKCGYAVILDDLQVGKLLQNNLKYNLIYVLN